MIIVSQWKRSLQWVRALIRTLVSKVEFVFVQQHVSS